MAGLSSSAQPKALVSTDAHRRFGDGQPELQRAMRQSDASQRERSREMEIAYYQASIPAFALAGESEILGTLTRADGFAVEPLQRNAWLRHISIMKQVVASFKTGHILLEFVIPRMGKRADIVLVVRGTMDSCRSQPVPSVRCGAPGCGKQCDRTEPDVVRSARRTGFVRQYAVPSCIQAG